MRSLDEADLSDRERAAVRSALAEDPALAGEVDTIVAALAPAAAARFWHSLAGDCPRHRRPAAAVLAALERAAAR